MTKIHDFTKIASGSDLADKRPIEFVHRLSQVPDVSYEVPRKSPETFENIALIKLAHSLEKYDIILAWGKTPNAGVIYLGHWNDGVI